MCYVVVRDNNVEQALRAMKKKMQREGTYRRMKECRYYVPPCDKKKQKKAECQRRRRKLLRRREQIS